MESVLPSPDKDSSVVLLVARTFSEDRHIEAYSRDSGGNKNSRHSSRDTNTHKLTHNGSEKNTAAENGIKCKHKEGNHQHQRTSETMNGVAYKDLDPDVVIVDKSKIVRPPDAEARSLDSQSNSGPRTSEMTAEESILLEPTRIQLTESGADSGRDSPASQTESVSPSRRTESVSPSGRSDTDRSSDSPGRHSSPRHSSLMDLFGVQLEVTSRLLEAERRKLAVLQRELEVTTACNLANHHIHTEWELEQLRVNIARIQQQYDQLGEEYDSATKGLMRNTSKLRTSYRSQPAIGLKPTTKPRPTIFGTLAQDSPDGSPRRAVGPPQMYLYPPSVVTMASSSSSSSSSATSSNGYHGDSTDGTGHQPGGTDDKGLVYQDGNLVAGSLESLLQHIVPTAHYRPERTYIFAFLLSSRLYVRPHQLFNQVCQTCIYQQNLMADTINRDSLGKFGPHFIQLLGEWTDNYPYDFRDERMMRCLKDMTQRLVAIYPELRKDVGILMHNLISKLSGLNKYEELLTRINAEVAQRLLNIMPTTDIYEVSPEPLVLAQQLTHIELERLSMIGPEEFVQAFAKETDKETTYKDLKKTNNLESYVHWFNRLSYFVATEICMHLKKKNRVRLIEYFMDVAKECINIGNFNSLMAIIAGLNMNPIQRLKKTWEKVNKEKFEILEHQMNPANNFASYRSSLKAALWRSEGAVEDRQRIVIPFFSLLVKDMYFLNEGCASKLDNGLLNFEKFWHLAKQISEFITWKQVDCPFDRHPPVLNYLLTNPVFSENSLSLASFECESPENSYEKQRYKSLKEQAGL